MRRLIFELRVIRGWFAFLLLTPCSAVGWHAGYMWLLPMAGEWGYSDDAREIEFGPQMDGGESDG